MKYILKNKLTQLLFILTVIAFSGCGYKQSNTQIKDVGFLKFTKSMLKEYTIIVNEQYKFKLDSCVQKDKDDLCDSLSDKLYEVRSGNSTIEVYNEAENLIMRKEFYIGSSNTVEVDLP